MESIFQKENGSMKRFFKMLWKARLPYVWIGASIVLTAVLANVGISVTEYTAEMFAGNVGLHTVILPFLFFELLSLSLSSLSSIMEQLCVARIDRNLRRMIWGKAVKLPLGYYEKNKPRELVSRITTDVTVVSQLVMQVFAAILTSFYTVVITLRKIGSYDRSLMLSLIVMLPLNVLIAFIVGKFSFGIRDVVNKRRAQLTQIIGERVNHFLLIKSMGTEEKERRTGQTGMQRLYKSSIFNAWLRLDGPMYAIAGMMQFIVIVLAGRRFYADGSLSLSQWIAYYGFAINIVNILTSYCGYWSTFKESQGATNRVASVMEESEENLEKGEDLKSLSGDISVEDLCFSFGTAPIFETLNLQIPAGCVTALIGPSGSGKTTFLNLLMRLYPVDSGKIFFGGKEIGASSLKSYRTKITYVTQEAVMFSGSVRDNLLWGIGRRVTEQELEQVCEEAGILDFIRQSGQGFDMDVGENGARLSGGQKQRIAIARALLERADYLLLDEATAAMDIKSKDGIWAGIRRCMKGKTVLMVAHDSQTVQKADYIIVMKEGKVVNQGSREELAGTDAYYQKLMGREN